MINLISEEQNTLKKGEQSLSITQRQKQLVLGNIDISFSS